MVRGRKAADPPPPLHRVQGLAAPDQEVMEGHREDSRAEASKGALRQVAVEGEVCGAVLVFLRSTRIGCIGASRKPPEEKNVEEESDEEGETGWAHLKCVFSCFFWE